jgi:hypothetical protein
MAKKVRGGKVTTSIANQNILDVEQGFNRKVTNVSIVNLGLEEIHVIINDGDKLPIDSNETLNLGNLVIDSIIVVEKGATVKFIGVE